MAGTRNNYFRTSDNAILYFEDHSPEKGSPIVLVPGFCCTTRFFENNLEALSKEHRVITFDPRGQGSSSKGLPWPHHRAELRGHQRAAGLP